MGGIIGSSHGYFTLEGEPIPVKLVKAEVKDKKGKVLCEVHDSNGPELEINPVTGFPGVSRTMRIRNLFKNPPVNEGKR